MSFDPNKPVQRRDGKPARIRFADLKGERPIVATHEHEDGSGEEYVEFHYPDGRLWLNAENPSDLVNIPETVTTYRNVDADAAVSRVCYSRDEADRVAMHDRIAVLILHTTDGVTVPELELVEGRS